MIIGQILNYPDYGGVRWIVYCGEGNRQVTVPVIPEPLASVYNVPSFGKLYEDPFSYGVGLINYPMIAGYDDYMNRTFIGTPLKAPESIAKSISYNKQTGGRFASVETLPTPFHDEERRPVK